MSGEKKTHIRYFVEPRTGDGLNTQPYPVALEEVGSHIKNWLARFEHQGYYSGVGCRIMLGEIAFRLEPVVCGEDGQPWDWTHCAVCDKELDSHGDCSDANCKTHTDEAYTGEPKGSSVAGVRVVSAEELVAILRRDEAANREHLERENLRDELEAATGQAYSDAALQAHLDAALPSTCPTANGRDLEAFEADRRGFVDKLSAEEKAFIAERESDNAKMDEAREYSAEDVEEWQRRSEEQGE
jgi:hypothetical protein